MRDLMSSLSQASQLWKIFDSSLPVMYITHTHN